MKIFLVFITLTDLLFILFKFTYLREVVTGFVSNSLFSIKIVNDPSDITALVMNFFSYQLAQKFKASSEPV